MTLPTISTPHYSLTLPSSGKQIQYRPFLVREEKLLLMAMESDDPKEAVRATRQAIENCCTGIEDFDSLALFDIEYILLQLRSKSVGEVAEPAIRCPKCNGNIPLKIDLSKVEVKKSKGHTNKIALTDTVGMVMKYPDYRMMDISPQSGTLNTEQLFELVLACIDYIYDDKQQHKAAEQTPEELHAFVEQLTQAHFVKIQEFFDTMPHLEHVVSYTCKNSVQTDESEQESCGHKGKVTLRGIQDFFE